MKYATLCVVQDEYSLDLGFKVKGTPSFESFMADRTGTMIAHDIVEHQNGLAYMGAVWDELEALGGVWHCRGRWGDIGEGSIHSPQVHVASDIIRMFGEWDGENGPFSIRTKAHVYDDDFFGIIDIARKGIKDEYDDCDVEQVDQFLNLALHRMRNGYRKCECRFGERFGSNNQYRAIKYAVFRAIPLIEFEGQEFRLAYGKEEATVREIIFNE